MRITTWNINGIRAALKKGLTDWVASNRPDILCLQEIKARVDQVVVEQREFQGYSTVWYSASRPGYSGVALYYQASPLEIKIGLGIEKFDVEGRVICVRYPEFYLYNVYFPNGQRGADRVQYKLDFYAALLQQCDNLHSRGQAIIIAGDFNTAHSEIDLANPQDNQTTSGFLPEERMWIDIYLQHGFVDIYRELYPQKVEYTWWPYYYGARRRNFGWRIDYFLISRELVDKVEDVVIHGEVTGSDHCPVTLSLVA